MKSKQYMEATMRRTQTYKFEKFHEWWTEEYKVIGQNVFYGIVFPSWWTSLSDFFFE